MEGLGRILAGSETLLKKGAREAQRIVRQLAEGDIANLLVEGSCLKLMRIQPCAVAPACYSLCLREFHELLAYAHASEASRYDKKLSEQPAIARVSPETTGDHLVSYQRDNEWTKTARTGLRFVVRDERSNDLAANIFVSH